MLEEKGFVKLYKSINMGKIGFEYIGATERLFVETDSYLKGWNPEKDSITLAKTLVNLNKEGYGVSIQEVDEILKWGPRRLNPALFLLIEKDLVIPSKTLSPTYLTRYVILKPKVQRYIES